METIIIYLLKSAGLCSVFCILYILLLQNDTNFQLNRKFLFGGLLTSFLLPLLYFTKKVYVEAIDYSQFTTVTESGSSEAITQSINWFQLAGIIYLVVTGVLLIKFLLQLSQIFYLIISKEHIKIEGYNYIESEENSGPFSFFNYIIYNPHLHSKKELELILLHEKIHARQFHSVDILISNLATGFLWFNPMVWIYKKKIVQNLEYIADRETVRNSSFKKEYLQALVKVSTKDYQPALTSSFYQSFIKKRILMLHKTKTSNSSWKVALAFPLLLAFMLVFNVKTEASIIPPKDSLTFENGTKQVIEFNFNENTSKDQLKEFQEKFKEKGIKLEFQDVEYSKDKLKSLSVSYSAKTGDKKTFKSEKDADGNLKPFAIIAVFSKNNELETINFAGPDEVSWTDAKDVKVIKTVKNATDENGNVIREVVTQEVNTREPVYVVDGKVIKDVKWVKNLDPNKIASVNVVKGETATKVYGNSGENGVIEIITKKEGDTTKAPQSIIAFQKDDAVMMHNNKSKVKVVSTSDDPENKPLFIVNGEELKEGEEMTSIDPDKIASVIIFKEKKAIEKYGEKGKNGVVVISTKDAKTPAQEAVSMYRINAAFSDAQLKELKKMVEKETGYVLLLENVKRNNRGKISKIQVKFSGKGHTVNGNFDETNGIPDIIFGIDKNGGVSISSK